MEGRHEAKEGVRAVNGLFEDRQSGAILSQCRTYRYYLWRRWREGTRIVAFVGLNPSTADETIDDPTIRRCISFAKSWEFDALRILNLFAYRTTDPKILKNCSDPIGPKNDGFLYRKSKRCELVVACWGAFGSYKERARFVLKNVLGFRDIYYLELTKEGHPKHPLYLRKDCTPKLLLVD